MTTFAVQGGDEKWEQDLGTNLICPQCKEDPPDLVESVHSGDLVCQSCGLVVGDRVIDMGSEWRTFSNDDQNNDDPSRVGDAENPLLNGNQLHTTIAYGNGGAASRDLHRAQNRVVNDKANQNLQAAYRQINAYCDSFGAEKRLKDHACYLYKNVDDAKFLKGKSQDAIIAGCIAIACRQLGVSRTFKEIFNLTRVPKKDIGRIFKQLADFFSSEMNSEGAAFAAKPLETTTAEGLCERYCNQLGLGFDVMRKCQQIAEKTSSIGALAGRSPLSTASACIYMGSYLMGQGKTAKEISVVAGVSDGTIRTAYKFLIAKKDELIDPKWLSDDKVDVNNLPQS